MERKWKNNISFANKMVDMNELVLKPRPYSLIAYVTTINGWESQGIWKT